MKKRTLQHIHLVCAMITTLVAGLLIQTGATAFAQTHSEREAYFGETHVHTSWSLDSYLGFGNTIAGPEDFYKYSLGQPITHSGGFTVKITKRSTGGRRPSTRSIWVPCKPPLTPIHSLARPCSESP